MQLGKTLCRLRQRIAASGSAQPEKYETDRNNTRNYWLCHHRQVEIIRVLLNILWLIFSGIFSALGYIVAGLIMFLFFFLVITIPFGIASFRLAGYALWPFGRTVVRDPDAGVASTIGNVVWFILAGLWLAIGQALVGITLCITIIGIPFGIANFKLARLSLNPLGKQIVPLEFRDSASGGVQTYVPVQ